MAPEHGIAIRKFFDWAKTFDHCKLREVIIDTCQMQDQTLAHILAGVNDQLELYESKDFVGKKHQFYSFCYAHDTFGSKSLEQLDKLLKDIIEVRLCSTTFTNSDIIYELNDMMMKQGKCKYLMKLSLVNINLGCDRIVEILCKVLYSRKHIQYLDLSETYLKPRHLEQVSIELADMYKLIRNVNISYNSLDFRVPGSDEHKHSTETIRNLKEMLKKAKILNHINLSGMRIPPEEMIPLCKQMAKGALMMGIHLNDNGVTKSLDYMLKVLAIFDLDVKDIPKKRLDLIDPDNPRLQTNNAESRQYKKRSVIHRRINMYMRFDRPEKKTEAINKKMVRRKSSLIEQNKVDAIVDAKRTILKENLVLGKEYRDYENQKARNISMNTRGIGRTVSSHEDRFVLSRILSHPELMFN